jgi:GPH family glycoside/pentoside/hexuronide:cation symporter
MRTKTSSAEKITYGLGGIGYQMTLALANAFLVLYYTDSAMLSAAFVGTMMLVARLLDGVSDIVMGIVIEKTATRFGKARPWVLIGSIPLAVSMVLLFNVPSHLPEISKNAYAFVTYVFMSVICYTITALAHTAMLPRISLDSTDRGVTTVVVGLMQGIVTAALIGGFAPLIQALGGESSQSAWTVISLIIAVSSFLLLSVCFIVTKEKMSAKAKTVDDTGKIPDTKTPLKEALPFLLKGRYFYIIIVLYLTMAITNGTAGIGVYYMRDVLGNANLMGIFSICSVIPMIIAMPVTPTLFAKFGKRKTLIYCLGFTILVRIVMFMFPTNISVQMAGAFLGTLAVVPLWIATPNMICDLVDYGDYKRGIRMEGLAVSASSFGTKLGMGLGSLMLGNGLALGGYNALATVQSDATKDVIIFIMIGVPGIICVLCFALVCLWNMEIFKPEVDAYMKARNGGD